MRVATTVRGLAVALALAAGLGPSGSAQEADGDLSITLEGFGPVELRMTEGDLLERLGADAVRRSHAYIGEGMCAPGSRVALGGGAEIDVVWADTARAAIVQLSVGDASSRWRTPAGVAIGSTLGDLERIAGGPVEFLGFEWDYGGRARWAEPGARVWLDLAPTEASNEEAVRDPLYREIIGDRIVRSDHPLVRRMTIQVRRITLQTGTRTGVEYECPAGPGSGPG